MNKVIFVIISAIFALNLFACEEEKEEIVYGQCTPVSKEMTFDIENLTPAITVINVGNTLLSNFKIYHNSKNFNSNSIYIKSITLGIKGSGSNTEESAFHDALDGFYLVINNHNKISASYTSNTEIIFLPLNGTDALNPFNPSEFRMDLYVENIKSSIPELYGEIFVKKIKFATISSFEGSDPEEIEAEWNPSMGPSQATAINQPLDDGSIPQWQKTLINILAEEDVCTEDEIKLNNGRCVLDKCIDKFCGKGSCEVNLDNGGAFCICEPGYGLKVQQCTDRLAKFDIESTQENISVPNHQEQILIGEWEIRVNAVEDGEVNVIRFIVHGDLSAFSNFNLKYSNNIYTTGVNFGEIQREEITEDNTNRMRLSFEYYVDDEIHHEIVHRSKISLFADVAGETGNQISSYIETTFINSTSVQDENGYGLMFALDESLGLSETGSSYAIYNSLTPPEMMLTTTTIQ